MRRRLRAEISGWVEISADRGLAVLALLPHSKRLRRMARRMEIPALIAHRKVAAEAIAALHRRAVVDRMAAVRLTAETTADRA
jgi:predicted Fe-S protein YdhL (DUF1289 family)